MKDKIKQLLFKNGKFISARNEKWLSLNYPEMYEWLMLQFDDYEEYSQKARAVYNGDYCRCAECNGIMLYPNDRSRKYCSAECSSKAKSRKLSNSHDGSRIQKMRDTMIERYGVDNASRIPNISRKPIDYSARLEKARMTNLERYGGWPMQNSSVKEKAIASNIRKYGVSHRLCNSEQYALHLETMMQRHGVQYAMQDSKLKEKNMISKFRNVIDTSECNTYEDAKRKYLESIGVYLTDVPFAVGTPATRMMSADVAKIYSGEQKFSWDIMQCSYKDFYGAARKYGVRAADQGKSVPERQLLEFAKTIGRCMANVRDVIPGMELDVYLPDYGLALEFNGLYWHDYFNGKPKDYHLKKTQACLNAGIQLVHVWEDHWKNHKEIVKSSIMRACGMEPRIDANECTITPTTRIAAGQFYSYNAILPWKESGWHLALCVDYAPVAMLSYSVFESIATVDMYAIANGIIVDGAIKRFLKYIRESHPRVRTIHIAVSIDSVYYAEIKRIGLVSTSCPKPCPRLVNRKTMQSEIIDKSFLLKEISNLPNEFDEKSSNFVIKLLKESYFLLYNAGNLTMEMKDGKCNDNCRKDPGTIRV